MQLTATHATNVKLQRAAGMNLDLAGSAALLEVFSSATEAAAHGGWKVQSTDLLLCRPMHAANGQAVTDE